MTSEILKTFVTAFALTSLPVPSRQITMFGIQGAPIFNGSIVIPVAANCSGPTGSGEGSIIDRHGDPAGKRPGLDKCVAVLCRRVALGERRQRRCCRCSFHRSWTQ